MRGEFELIEKYFAPLAEGAPGSLGLTDDAALLTVPEGRDLVLTADAMIEGVHFLPDQPPDLVARKLLRVNLSDLAAMGAQPLGYLVTAAWPDATDESWIAAFAQGLAEDQGRFDIHLLGGDTTRTAGPVALSLTAAGTVPAGGGLRRSTARAGDVLFVSGTIGDSLLGLKVLRGELEALGDDDRAALVARHRLPEPRLALGRALLEEGLATAAIDLSDGLIADIGHIAETSGLAARVAAAAVPLSPAAQRAVAHDAELRGALFGGGEDFELAFAAAPERAEAVAALGRRLALPIAQIGDLARGEGVRLVGENGEDLPVVSAGWTHF
ncbi:MAG: thiamine-phosphate kinase [Kiloniellales bacterium]|nr:thiamine-phosphate kinase [Kiloniellales bacterium]